MLTKIKSRYNCILDHTQKSEFKILHEGRAFHTKKLMTNINFFLESQIGDVNSSNFHYFLENNLDGKEEKNCKIIDYIRE